MSSFVQSIAVHRYRIPAITHFSGEVHYTEFGTPVPIEYWRAQPDFSAINEPIVEFLRKRYLGHRIGIRVLGSEEHPGYSADELIELILALGHDRHEVEFADNPYENTDLHKAELFMLEIDIGQYEGVNGEEQVEHALRSKYVYTKSPVRVDIVILYDLNHFDRREFAYNGRSELGHVFRFPERKGQAVLGVLKLV